VSDGRCAFADVRVGQDNAKVGLFIAAATGTALMAAVFCIYNQFYTKQQYLHTQLDDHLGTKTLLLRHVASQLLSVLDLRKLPSKKR